MKKCLVFYIILILGCKNENTPKNETLKVSNTFRKNLVDKKNWWHKDITKDSLPGISLDKTYNELIKDKKGDTIIVAVLDGGIDINHEELKDIIWNNKNEIPNNFIDDDDNGYTDDIHGWNFLGNQECGNVYYENFEFIRIIKKYNSYFNKLDTTTLSNKDQSILKSYNKALKEYDQQIIELKDDYMFINNFIAEQNAAKLALKKHFPNENYTRKDLKNFNTNNDKQLALHIKNRSHALKYNMDDNWIKSFKNYVYIKDEYKLNFDYNGREFINDNLNDINDTDYGNNDVIGDLTIESHGTSVSGLIGASRKNNIGIKGVLNTIKIMPVRIVADGDEYDKDIALGIKYAVDNGARIINLSVGKAYSMNPTIVYDAIKYAAQKNVLIVCAAGNSSFNTDKVSFYPNDINYSNINKFEEITENLIKVGASSYKVTKRLYSSFSNYGKNTVDLFAPGQNIYFPLPNNKYDFDEGTSLSAPIVSGIAALILSHYPKFSANELKNILINSGIEFSLDVQVQQPDGTKRLVPFSELSKSGTIVNAYNALQMAEQLSKK